VGQQIFIAAFLGVRQRVWYFLMQIPADTRSTTGCSPIGSAGKSPRFVLMPHDSNEFQNHRIRQLTDLD
jgi:hypothetical protein